VFHVTTSSSGSVKWSQVSEDLVPVNISAITTAKKVELPTVAAAAAAAAAEGDSLASSASASALQAQQQQIIFHVTAYNSQVEKILDVRLVQPGRNTINIIPCIISKQNTENF
jgi:hypothetical protein